MRKNTSSCINSIKYICPWHYFCVKTCLIKIHSSGFTRSKLSHFRIVWQIDFPICISFFTHYLHIVCKAFSTHFIVVNQAYFSSYLLYKPHSGCIVHTKVKKHMHRYRWLIRNSRNSPLIRGSSHLVSIVCSFYGSLKTTKVLLLQHILIHSISSLFIEHLVGYNTLSFFIIRLVGSLFRQKPSIRVFLCYAHQVVSVVFTSGCIYKNSPSAILFQDWAYQIPAKRIGYTVFRENTSYRITTDNIVYLAVCSNHLYYRAIYQRNFHLLVVYLLHPFFRHVVKHFLTIIVYSVPKYLTSLFVFREDIVIHALALHSSVYHALPSGFILSCSSVPNYHKTQQIPSIYPVNKCFQKFFLIRSCLKIKWKSKSCHILLCYDNKLLLLPFVQVIECNNSP